MKNSTFLGLYCIPEDFIEFSKYMIFILLATPGFVMSQLINFQDLIDTNAYGTIITVILKGRVPNLIYSNTIIFASTILVSLLIPVKKYFSRILYIVITLILIRILFILVLNELYMQLGFMSILFILNFIHLKKTLNALV
jgi:hypothetical protein